MEQQLTLRIILEQPIIGVDFGLQKGSGTNYETIQKQRSATQDLSFDGLVTIKAGTDNQPDFKGAIVQGTLTNRFVYIDIGRSAGQLDTAWSRRLKIPLKGITTEMIDEVKDDSTKILETKVAGTGTDGGPNCGTVKPFFGWYITAKQEQH